jgi:hypothetical protein
VTPVKHRTDAGAIYIGPEAIRLITYSSISHMFTPKKTRPIRLTVPDRTFVSRIVHFHTIYVSETKYLVPLLCTMQGALLGPVKTLDSVI